MARRAKKNGSFARGFLSVFGTALVIVLVALAVALAVVPRVVHGAALTVLTGSMEPTFSPGDMIVVEGVENPEQDIEIGDVITFMPNPDDPTLITHRVVSKSINPVEGTSFVTQGDANSAADEPILPKQIRGEFMYAIPYIGHATSWLSAHTPWIGAAAGVGLIVYGLFSVFRGSRRRSQNAPDNAEDKVEGSVSDGQTETLDPVAQSHGAAPAAAAPASPPASAPGAPGRRRIPWATAPVPKSDGQSASQPNSAGPQLAPQALAAATQGASAPQFGQPGPVVAGPQFAPVRMAAGHALTPQADQAAPVGTLGAAGPSATAPQPGLVSPATGGPAAAQPQFAPAQAQAQPAAMTVTRPQFASAAPVAEPHLPPAFQTFEPAAPTVPVAAQFAAPAPAAQLVSDAALPAPAQPQFTPAQLQFSPAQPQFTPAQPQFAAAQPASAGSTAVAAAPMSADVAAQVAALREPPRGYQNVPPPLAMPRARAGAQPQAAGSVSPSGHMAAANSAQEPVSPAVVSPASVPVAAASSAQAAAAPTAAAPMPRPVGRHNPADARPHRDQAAARPEPAAATAASVNVAAPAPAGDLELRRPASTRQTPRVEDLPAPPRGYLNVPPPLAQPVPRHASKYYPAHANRFRPVELPAPPPGYANTAVRLEASDSRGDQPRAGVEGVPSAPGGQMPAWPATPPVAETADRRPASSIWDRLGVAAPPVR
ncbi:MAG: signal peptidase I [Bifidobacteriaceae bacterium]|jgi:signal peptidase|nr:signal peptidase I [Bifidobacteriaceae bacterium]